MKISYLLLMTALFVNNVLQAQKKIDVTEYGAIPNSFSDATSAVRKAIEAARNETSSVINFPEGRYDFWPDQAEEHVYYISNTSTEKEYPSKKQRAGLYLKGMKNITIEGNNATFIFHGKMISWILDNCENIRIQNVKIDYERPGMSELTIVEATSQYVIGNVHPDAKFDIIDNTLAWYGEKWVSKNFHAILVDTVKGINVYSSWIPFRNSKAQIIAPLKVKFTGDFSKFRGKSGDILTVRDTYRDYVGALVYESKDIALDHVYMHYMQGLGIVSQFSENLHYDHVYVEPAMHSGRVMASSADGMHFSGCKGEVIVDNCRFKGMHDDPINVHGTHLKVVEVVSPTALKLRFMHGQSYGFMAFHEGDTIGFVQPATLQVFNEGIIKKASLVSEREMLVELDKPISKAVQVGTFLENITATPAVTIRNSRFERTNTRGILVTTRKKVIIENNVFIGIGMHAILIENDALGWFESGPVQDVTIENNLFENCAYNSYPGNYIIQISPQNSAFLPNYWVHKNIKIENNRFKVYDYPVLSVKSTDGLLFNNNKIVRTNFMKSGDKRAEIQLIGAKNVTVRNNDFGGADAVIEIEKMSKKDVKTDLKEIKSIN